MFQLFCGAGIKEMNPIFIAVAGALWIVAAVSH